MRQFELIAVTAALLCTGCAYKQTRLAVPLAAAPGKDRVEILLAAPAEGDAPRRLILRRPYLASDHLCGETGRLGDCICVPERQVAETHAFRRGGVDSDRTSENLAALVVAPLFLPVTAASYTLVGACELAECEEEREPLACEYPRP